jgi:putative peptide zinc metalloprotease protein
MGSHGLAVAAQPRPDLPPPRAREDLEVHERELDGRQVFVVFDALLGRYHQLGAAAFAVLEAIENGDVPVANLPRELGKRHGVKMSFIEVGNIIAELEKLDLLEVTPARARQKGEPDEMYRELGRLRANDREAFLALQAQLLKKWQPKQALAQRARRMRMHLWNPEPLLIRLEPVARVLFKKRTAWAVGMLALAALAIQLEHGARLRVELGGVLAQPLFFLTVALCVTLLHELGHGLACHHFGGRVKDVGVMLLYFCIPAAYCDVTDAHLIDSRQKRAVVAMAGCYVNVILWVVATLLWRVLSPDLWITRVALGVIGTTGLSLFLNLNPLLPLDGYYALEEVLGVQNLRQKGGIYKWAQTLYVWVLVPLALGRMFGFLVERFRLTGFVIFMALAAITLRPLVLRAWRWVMAPS